MATAALCGMSGTITGITGLTEITNWEVSRTVEALDATSMASAGWKERIACLKGATGSCKSYQKPAMGAASVTLDTLAGAGGNTIAGAILISKITCTTDVNNVVEFATDFTFTGAITIG